MVTVQIIIIIIKNNNKLLVGYPLQAILYEKRTADGQRGAPPSNNNKNKCCTATSVAVQTSMQLK